jgi:glutaredoxin
MKRSFLIIVAIFAIGIVQVRHFATPAFSDEPVVLTRNQAPEITMFSSQSCKYCAIARSFFEKNQLSYTEYHIENSDKDWEMFQLLGGTGTPLIIVNGNIIHGFDEHAIRSSL